MSSIALKQYYSNGSAGTFEAEGLSLFHPAFSQDWHFTNWVSADANNSPLFAFKGNVRGVEKDFITHSFEFSKPTLDPSGQQRFSITIANTGRALMKELIAAHASPQFPIELQVDTFLIGDVDAQDDPFVFLIDRVGVGINQVTLYLSGTDILTLGFPRKRFTATLHPGLSR